MGQPWLQGSPGLQQPAPSTQALWAGAEQDVAPDPGGRGMPSPGAPRCARGCVLALPRGDSQPREARQGRADHGASLGGVGRVEGYRQGLRSPKI